ncbi:hypothetical protein NPIL_383961 [Nephila pilipes]|uniref:Uncharacterized protein n=1 Tax=Nephila pilipes TaxID=299642 RepID=A0A8X6MVG1_NEPPI|nr:hypothetical protein NPIL_383961 [Nephila pilipes]
MARTSDVKRKDFITMYWNIVNYSCCWQKRGDSIMSPEFHVESNEKTSWNIFLYPRGENERVISFALYGSCTAVSDSMRIEREFAILAEDGSILLTNTSKREMVPINVFRASSNILTEGVTKREAFLSQDTLRIRCKIWRTDRKVVKPVAFFARTILSKETRRFVLNIERFSLLKSDIKYNLITGRESEADVTTFDIGVNGEDKIIILIKYSDKEVKYLSFQSFISDTNDSKIDCGKCENRPNEFMDIPYSLPFTFRYMMDNKNLYLKDDVLFLFCEYSWCNGYVFDGIDRIDLGITSPVVSNRIIRKPCKSNTVSEQSESLVHLKEDFQSLYAEGILSDVKIQTATQIFPTHKNILSARSRVFRKRFVTNMEENQECVDVPYSAEIVGRMLLYAYTDSLEGLEWESALEMYSLAKVYEMDSLLTKCCSFLKLNLFPNNLCEVLVLAEKYADCDLKKAAQEYVLKHEDVFGSEEWAEFTKNYTTLAAETMLLKWKK